MTPNQIVEPKTANVSQTRGAHYWLVAIGCILVILFSLGAVAKHFGGSETTEVTKPASEAIGGSMATEKTTTSTAWPSDTLLTTLLGAGAALVVVGFLYARISSVTLPGGAKVDLTAEEAKEGVKETLDKLPDDASPNQTAAAVTKTLGELQQLKVEGVQIATQQIAETAERAVAPIVDG